MYTPQTSHTKIQQSIQKTTIIHYPTIKHLNIGSCLLLCKSNLHKIFTQHILANNYYLEFPWSTLHFISALLLWERHRYQTWFWIRRNLTNECPVKYVAFLHLLWNGVRVPLLISVSVCIRYGVKRHFGTVFILCWQSWLIRKKAHSQVFMAIHAYLQTAWDKLDRY